MDKADKFIFYKKVADSFISTREIKNEEEVDNMTSLLTRNLQQEVQRKFIPDNKIEVYKNDHLLGTLLNSTKEGFVNFANEYLKVGFHLTYGIGQSL